MSKKFLAYLIINCSCLCLLALWVMPQAEAAAAFQEQQAIARVLQSVNKERAEHHAAPLHLDPALMQAAQLRLQEIEQQFSHYRPNGEICFTLLHAEHIRYRFAGENIVRGIDLTPEEAVKLWIDSPTHCCNMRRKIYTNTGIAAARTADGMVYYIQIFTKPKKSQKN